MKVTLIDSTKNARELLIFSKKTRLKMSPNSYAEIMNMPEEQKQKEIDYVFNTIGSSWEFVDYVFMIEDVTRAFTHQLVRHRVGVSFAQQSQRTVDMSKFEYMTPESCQQEDDYHRAMISIEEHYSNLISKGIKPEDARGILPTNVLTNIMMKINLRALAEMMNVRLCHRSQGEFRAVADEMKKIVVGIHPFTDKILQPSCIHPGVCKFKNYRDCPLKQSF